MSEEVVPKSLSKPVVKHVLPTLYLDSTDMPEIANYDVGQTYDAIIHCEMISKHQGSEGLYGEPETPGLIRGKFRIISIKPTDSTSDNSNGKMKAIKKAASKY